MTEIESLEPYFSDNNDLCLSTIDAIAHNQPFQSSECTFTETDSDLHDFFVDGHEFDTDQT